MNPNATCHQEIHSIFTINLTNYILNTKKDPSHCCRVASSGAQEKTTSQRDDNKKYFETGDKSFPSSHYPPLRELDEK